LAIGAPHETIVTAGRVLAGCSARCCFQQRGAVDTVQARAGVESLCVTAKVFTAIA